MFKYTKLLKMLAFVAPAVVAVQPANYTIFSTSNNISASNSKVDASNTADMEINYSDNGVLSNINSFDDYSSIYTDAKTPVLTTDVGTLGMNNDKNTIVLTAYNGLVVWANNLVNNDAVKKFYSTLNTPVNDISSYTVKSWQKVDNSNNAIILFSDATNSNVSVFLIDLRNGQLIKNTNGDLVATTVTNNGSIIYQTADDKSFFVINTTYGPAKEKLNNIDKVTISTDFSSITNNVLTGKGNNQLARNPDTDIFYGYAPGAIGGGVNYAFFYCLDPNDVYGNKGSLYQKIYITAIDNDFNKKGGHYGSEYDTNDSNQSIDQYKGWQTAAGDAQEFTNIDEEWQNINKQFLYMGDRNNYSWTKGDKDRADWIVMNSTSKNDYNGNWGANGKPVNGEKYIIRFIVINRSESTTYNRYVFKGIFAFTNELTSLSVGTNSIYYTSKANETGYNYEGHPSNPGNRNAIKKEVAGMIYIDYVNHSWGNQNNDLVYVVNKRRYTLQRYGKDNDDSYKDPATYKKSTIAPIDGYSNKTKLGYQLITPNATVPTQAQVGTYSGDNPNVLDTNVNDYQATSYPSTYHKVEDVQNALTTGLGKNKLPSEVTADTIKPYLKFKYEGQTDATTPGTGYTVTPTVSNQNDNNGSLDYSYKVDFTTEWNKRDDKTYPSSFTISNTLNNLYIISDFSFQFVTSNTIDSTKWAEIQKLMNSGSAIKVTKANVLANFIKYTIKDKNDQNFTITEDMVALTYGNKNSELTVTITLPADRFPTGLASKLTQTHTFTGFQNSPNATADLNTNGKNNITVTGNTVTVDLTKGNIGNIAKSINATTLTNGINTTYKDSFMTLFTVSGYEYVITSTGSNPQNGTANFKITFTIKNDYIGDQTKEYNVNFTGLIKPASISVQQYSNVTTSGQNITLDLTKGEFGTIEGSKINTSLRVEKFIEGLDTTYKATLEQLFAKTGYELKGKVTNTTTEDNQSKGIATLTMTYTVMSGYEGNDITWNITVQGLSPKLPAGLITVNPNNKTNVTRNDTNITVDLTNESLSTNINKDLRIEKFLNGIDSTDWTYKSELSSALFSATGYTMGDFSSTTTDDQQRSGIAKLSVTFTKTTGYDGDDSITYNITINGLARKQDTATVDFDTTTSRPFVELDSTNKTATISLSKGSLGNINSTLTTNNFKSGINGIYKSDILSLFTYSQGYTPTISYQESDVDKLNGTIVVKVTFEKASNYDGDQTVEYTLTFTGFTPVIDAYVNINNNLIDSSNGAIVYTETTKTINVNLSNYSLGNITNKMYSSDFVSNVNNYSTDILQVFDIKDYGVEFEQTTSDSHQGTATIKITFTNKIDESQLVYTINFSGFNLLSYVYFDMNMISQFNNVTINEISNTNMDVTIDLSKNKFNSISSDLMPDEMAKDFSVYQNDILSLFEYDANEYTPTFNTIYDQNNNGVDVEVVFTLNNQLTRNASKAVEKPQKITTKVSIVGFDKQLITTTLISIIAIIAIAILAIVILITTWSIISKRKATKIAKPNKNNKFIKK